MLRGSFLGTTVSMMVLAALLTCSGAWAGEEKTLVAQTQEDFGNHFLSGTVQDLATLTTSGAPAEAVVAKIYIRVDGMCAFGDLLYFELVNQSRSITHYLPVTDLISEFTILETNITAFNDQPFNQTWILRGSGSNTAGEYVDYWRITVSYDDAAFSSPDLAVSSSSRTPGAINPGETLSVGYTVANNGAVDAGGFAVSCFADSDAIVSDTSVPALASENIASLTTGASASGTLNITWPDTGALSAPGTYYLAVLADSGGAVSESDEDNNWGTVLSVEVLDVNVDSDGDGVRDSDDAFPWNACGATDTDTDGLGDEWEMLYFSSLDTADQFSDSDYDGQSDLREFDACYLGLDPTDATSRLPIGGPLCGIMLAASLAGLGIRRLRR